MAEQSEFMISDILAAYPAKEASLIEVLQDVQARFHYLPEEALKLIASTLRVPLSKVYAVATFYKVFRLTPRGKNHIKICTGTACHVRGAPLLLDEIKARFGIQAGETSSDKKYTLDAVNCVGACAMAPVVIVNEKYYGNISPLKLKQIFEGSNPDEN